MTDEHAGLQSVMMNLSSPEKLNALMLVVRAHFHPQSKI
eukprot:UN09468